jgi:hypothetical protein
MPRERDLRVGRGRNRASRIRERHEEAVALRVYLDAAVALKRFAEQTPVVCENAGISVAELVQQASRPLDVREEQGHGSARELRHENNDRAATGSQARPHADADTVRNAFWRPQREP